MRLGRIDGETTANIGLIEGGLAANIVPNRVRLRAEARSLSLAKLDAQSRHMRECLEQAAGRHPGAPGGRERTARVEARVDRDYDRLALGDDARIVRLLHRAAAGLAPPLRARATGGGGGGQLLAR